MKRREFLSGLACAAASASVPGLLRAQAQDAAARFASRAARHPWLAGWRTIGRESLGPTPAFVEGRLPGELAGVLYRNGPAWFDRGDFRYTHWFDGDGFVQAWRIENGAVQHRARMVATSKFVREQQAGRFLLPAAGSSVPDAVSIRNNDDMNTANTAVIRLGDRLLALWEGGSAFELDPEDLRSRAPVTWRDDLRALPFSAHPLREADGSMWNFGSLVFLGGSGLLIWRIGADGRTAAVTVLESDVPGYLHSFAMSDRHLIFMLMPIQRADGQAFYEGMRFAADQPCRVAVVPKDALDAPHWLEVDFSAVWHFADAWECAGHIGVHAVRHRDPKEARSPMAAAMRGEVGRMNADTELVTLRIDLSKGTARWDRHDIESVEFPTWDTRTPAAASARLYMPASIGPGEAPYFNGVVSFDPATDRRDGFRFPAQVMTEECRFVPRPGARRAGEGWLVGTVLDYGRDRSGLIVLDAEHVADGPLATAWVPYTVPLGFHGWFSGAA
jgi:carotenoid cleavage dioxygenase